MTRRQLLGSIGADELAEWQSFFILEKEHYDKKSGKVAEKLDPVTLSEKIKLAFKGGTK